MISPRDAQHLREDLALSVFISRLFVLEALCLKACRGLCRNANFELHFPLAFLKSLLHSGCVCFDVVRMLLQSSWTPLSSMQCFCLPRQNTEMN